MIRPDQIRNQCWVYRAEYKVIGKSHLPLAKLNGYPYNEHVRDCDICLAAQAVESLQARIAELTATAEKSAVRRNELIDENTDLYQRIAELEALFDRIAQDDDPDNFWQDDARATLQEKRVAKSGE